MYPVTCLELIFRYPVVLITVILQPFIAIGLGIYLGFNIKKRWFLPIIESSVFMCCLRLQNGSCWAN